MDLTATTLEELVQAMGGGAISTIATMTMNARSTYPDELDEPLGGLLVNNLEHAKIS